MRNAKLLSTLLATVLLCASVIGALFIGADAANPYELNVGGAGEFSTVAQALASIAEADLSGYDSVTVNVNADVTETFEGDLLFDCPTIWKEMGVMMPITVTGEGTLSLPVGTKASPRKIANANDITFLNMTVDIRTFYVRLFAGSGQLTFDGCSLGSGTAFNYRIFADNYTASVFEGWDEADYVALADSDGHINTSVTMKNADYPTNANYSIAAVGSSADFEATVGSLKISANNTKTEVNWENVATTYFYLRSGTNPVAKSTLNITNCTTTHGYRAAGFAATDSAAPETYTGDMEINITGGVYKNYGRLLHTCKLVADTSADKVKGVGDGNFTVTIKDAEYDPSTNGESKNYIQPCYSGCVIEGDFNVTFENMNFYRCYTNNGNGGTVMGDYSATIKNVDSCTFYGGFGSVYGSVTNNITGLNLTMQATDKTSVLDGIKMFQGSTVGNEEEYTGDHSENVGNINNNLTDCTFTGGSSYSQYGNTTSITYMTLGTYAAGTVAGNITNKLKNVTVDFDQIILIAGNYQGQVDGNVNTEIDGGSFYEFVGSEGSLVKGTITNTVKGDATFKDAFYAAGYFDKSALTVEGKVFNKILEGENGAEPQFLANDTKFSFYGGGHHTVIGSGVENEIKAGIFENIVQCGLFRLEPSTALGADENGNSIINRISGGTFKSYFYGGIASFEEIDAGAGQQIATIEGSIYNEISGGTFSGNRVALGNRFANLGENNPIINKITGGTFNCPVFMAIGGYSTVSSGSVESVSSTIEGGTFKKNVYAGNYGDSKVNSSCVLSVLGGTFEEDLVAGSSGDVSYDVTFTVAQTEGKTLNLYGKVLDIDTFTGIGQTICIGANTDIVADTAEGALTLLQTEGWLGHDYFASPATADLTVEEAEGAYGLYSLTETDTILLKGGYEISGATLIFEDRVGIRVLLDPEKTALYAGNFKYSVAKDGEAAFFEGTQLEKWTDLASGTVYDSFVICGIGLRDFGAEFTAKITGAKPITFSVNSLATLAQSTWTGDWKTFAQAICNLHSVYSDAEGVHDESVYALQAVTQELAFSRNDAAVASGSVTLLMSDAVGMKLSLNLGDTYTAGTLTATVNGHSIPSAVVVDGTSVTVTFFVRANAMTDAFTLRILDGESEIFSLAASIEKLASDLANSAGNENQENAQALLYYIQKGAAVA